LFPQSISQKKLVDRELEIERHFARRQPNSLRGLSSSEAAIKLLIKN